MHREKERGEGKGERERSLGERQHMNMSPLSVGLSIYRVESISSRPLRSGDGEENREQRETFREWGYRRRCKIGRKKKRKRKKRVRRKWRRIRK